jgi:hypothetical protein
LIGHPTPAREFEEVIVVGVLIEEMFRSDRKTDREITTRAVVVDAASQENEQDHSPEWMEKCVQKEFDRADIARDVR